MSFFKRLSEPSTWAGIAALATVAGLPPTTIGLVQQVIVGASGLVAIFTPEKSA